MLKEGYTICPGCGLQLPHKDLIVGEGYHASAACYALYGELAAYTLMHGDAYFIHQLIVDAYGAQHTGPHTKTIGTAYALVGLCLVAEHGYTGKQVQRVHMKMPKQSWPRLEPPKHAATITVADVLQAPAGAQRDARIQEWVLAVWHSWVAHHDWVRAYLKNVI